MNGTGHRGGSENHELLFPMLFQHQQLLNLFKSSNVLSKKELIGRTRELDCGPHPVWS
jgi:hypothetical protein